MSYQPMLRSAMLLIFFTLSFNLSAAKAPPDALPEYLAQHYPGKTVVLSKARWLMFNGEPVKRTVYRVDGCEMGDVAQLGVTTDKLPEVQSVMVYQANSAMPESQLAARYRIADKRVRKIVTRVKLDMSKTLYVILETPDRLMYKQLNYRKMICCYGG
ncbi:MAG: hypothetical protein OEZ39_02560 [Gammaproteobacteria bacterium]|nr:hypothetical protein [Gammaproteobacteria bacterium]MDH5650737.1 hypothetical protein [Gammaproteobacteria bacterium]